MAETLLSPGVLARENDSSFIGARPVTYGAAIIGPAVMGPVNIPTAVSTFSQYEAIFGGTVESGSQFYTYLNSIAARNYFAQGGESLLVTRVVTGSFTEATGSIGSTLTSGAILGGLNALSSSIVTSPNITGSTGGTSTNLTTTTDGGGSGAIATVTVGSQAANATVSNISAVTFTSAGSGYAVGDTITIASASLGATKPGGTDLNFIVEASDLVYTASFTLKTISEGEIMNNSQIVDSANGTLISGSNYNIRWEVASVNTASGQFSLLIRRGNDTNNQKAVLETYNNLSLDPTAANYIGNAIGDTYFTVEQDGVDTYVKTNGNYQKRSTSHRTITNSSNVNDR